MKTVYIFFGEMGCGKSYCAKQFAERHDFEFFEGDSVVTPKMLERVLKFKPLTEDMIEEYMDVLTEAIANKMESTDYLVVSQALYRNINREDLLSFLESLGYQVRMWWVRVSWWRNIKNLLTRPNGWGWIYYWLINKPFFQKPTHEHQNYYNIYLR